MDFDSNALAAQAAEEQVNELKAKLEKIRVEKEGLEAKLEEYVESHTRVSERLAQSKYEIRGRETEIANIKLKIQIEKEKMQQVLDGESGGGEMEGQQEGLKGKDAAKLALPSPEEAIKVLREQLDSIGSELGVKPLIGNRRDEDIFGKGKLDVHYLESVTITFGGDQCRFRITPTYTFQELTEDACRYWGVDPFDATLRDLTNTIWPMNGNVRQEIVCEIMKMNDTFSDSNENLQLPKIRLVGSSKPNIGGIGDTVAFLAENNMVSKKQREDYEKEFFSRLMIDESKMKKELGRKKTQSRAKRARLAIMKSLSKFFHGPREQPLNMRNKLYQSADDFEHVTKSMQDQQKRKNENNDAENAKEALKLQARLTGICLKLFIWVLFILVLGGSMALRYDVGIVYSNTLSFKNRLTSSYPMMKPLKFGNNSGRWIYPFLDDSNLENGVQYPFSQLEDTYSFFQYILGLNLFSVEGTIKNQNQNLVNLLANDIQVLVGSVEIRQNRVRDDSCVLDDFFKGLVTDNKCYSPYATRVASKESYGNPLSEETLEEIKQIDDIDLEEIVNNAFSYNTFREKFTLGHFSAYDDNGFLLKLPKTLSTKEVNLIFKALREKKWLDRQSRAVQIDFVLYNTNINVAVKTVILLEYSSAGTVYSTLNFVRTAVSFYDMFSGSARTTTYLLISCDVFIFLYNTYLLYTLVIDILVYGLLRTLSTLWNLILIGIWTCCMIGIILRIYFESITTAEKLDFANSQFDFREMEDQFVLYQSVLALDVSALLFSILLVFQFTQLNRRISAIWETTYRSTKIAVALLFCLILIMVGVIAAAFLVYGTKVDLWRSFQRATLESLSLLMGNFEYETFRDSDLFFTPVFYLFFSFVTFFVVLSFFTAIFIDSFFEVASIGIPEAQPQRFWTKLFGSPFYLCMRSKKK